MGTLAENGVLIKSGTFLEKAGAITAIAFSIAKAIDGYAKEKGIQPKNGKLFKNIVGKGVQATIQGDIFYAGKLKLFEGK